MISNESDPEDPETRERIAPCACNPKSLNLCIMRYLSFVFVILLLNNPISEAQSPSICGGPLDYNSYISFAESTIDLILLPERHEGRSSAGLGHLSKNDFNLMTEGIECTNLINHLDTFELKDSEEINPLQKPVFFKAGEFYFVLYVTPVASVHQESNGSVQIQGRYSGRTSVIVLNSDFEGVALFVI